MCKAICPSFLKGGHKNTFKLYSKISFNKISRYVHSNNSLFTYCWWPVLLIFAFMMVHSHSMSISLKSSSDSVPHHLHPPLNFRLINFNYLICLMINFPENIRKCIISVNYQFKNTFIANKHYDFHFNTQVIKQNYLIQNKSVGVLRLHFIYILPMTCLTHICFRHNVTCLYKLIQ